MAGHSPTLLPDPDPLHPSVSSFVCVQNINGDDDDDGDMLAAVLAAGATVSESFQPEPPSPSRLLPVAPAVYTPATGGFTRRVISRRGAQASQQLGSTSSAVAVVAAPVQPIDAALSERPQVVVTLSVADHEAVQ